jgi:hypothetical protein
MLSLSVDKKLDYSTPIFFVPLGVATANIKSTITQKNIPKKTTTSPSSFAKASADTFAKTNVKKPTTVAAAIPKKEETKKEIPPVIKKTDVKKVEPAKQEIVKQEVVKNTEPKIEPKKEVEPSKPVQETPKFIPPVAQALDTTQEIVPVIPENAHISHNYREVEALRKQAQLQKELVQTWKPPIGVSPDCACEISFFVNSTGKIENIKMVQSSSVIMFDISARQALFAMKMPQWTYGKPFTINFK